MLSFECDYNNGAHPKVLENLVRYNNCKPTPYGFDEFSERAKDRIREAIGLPDAQIFFLTGGTQTNATTIDSMLYQYEGVICVGSGHINVHEAGAVEFTEHKIITIPDIQGKMEARTLEKYLDDFYHDGNRDHAVHPGLVYITFPTELGTIYRSCEIERIYATCQQHSIPLFIDGARLGYGLAAEGCDITLPWLARHCDAFYIGGTKVGALCGEAVVFPKGAPKGFFTIVKRHGALLAKSRLAGAQFDALFTDGLYLSIARHAIDMAMQVRQLFIEAGIEVKDSPTNQQFVVLTNQQMEQLLQHVLFETWEPVDAERTLCRFVTSWATTDADLQALSSALRQL